MCVCLVQSVCVCGSNSLLAILVRCHKQIAIVRHQSNTYATDRTASAGAAAVRPEVRVPVVRPADVRVGVNAQRTGVLCHGRVCVLVACVGMSRLVLLLRSA